MSNQHRGSIPNRWLECPRKSIGLIADKFLAFKTPLSSQFNAQMPIENIFPPEMIFGFAKAMKLKLGLWIDLTNTKRFYDQHVIEDKGAKYVKLQCRGHGETPSVDQTRSFIEIVDNFISENQLDIIGVHCTHGFNRTGFLIVSYMVERLDWSVQAALQAFAQSRQPGIYKQDYIDELYRRYEPGEEVPPAPSLPDWCFEYDDSKGDEKRKREATPEPEDDDNDGAASGSDKPSHSKKKRRREMFIKDATFMEGVTGVVLVTDEDLLTELQRKVQRMCSWKNMGFPGCQPVSMDSKNLELLSKKQYKVSWKADGNRYMMLVNKENEVYFFDRNHSCFQVEHMRFPQKTDLRDHITDTLLDGEMVIDTLGHQTIPRYLVYDIVTFNNGPIGKHPFNYRLQCIKDEIIQPRHRAIVKGLLNKNIETFSIRNKEFWDVKLAGSLLNPKFTQCLTHKPDGLIFQPADEPYVPGPCQDVLKWKPLSLNSVDFKLKIGVERRMGMLPEKIGYLHVGDMMEPFASMKYTNILKDLDNKIIECTFKNGKWEFMRERTDKKHPNSYNTAKAVCESINKPITQENLLYYIEHHRFGKSDDKTMPPPPAPNQQQQQQKKVHNNV